jgi:hypothetical protein
MSKWINCAEELPKETDPMESGWVLVKFCKTYISTARYIGSHSRWQMRDYSWAKQVPMAWMRIPEELLDDRNKMDLIEEAVCLIRTQHHKIMDDWGKAYLAQLHKEGVIIRPGCYTLYEQEVTGERFSKKYWFERTPEVWEEDEEGTR